MEGIEFSRKLEALQRGAGKPNLSAPDTPLGAADITKYTADMWKYKPVSSDIPEPYPEYLCQYKALEGSTLLGARVRGKKHKHDGTNSDDWFVFDDARGWAVIAVSDGAGSRKLSRIGARASCEMAAAYIKQSLQFLQNTSPDVEEILALPKDDPRFSDACTCLARIVQQGVLAAADAVQDALVKKSTDQRCIEFLGRAPVLADFAATLLLTVAIPVDVAGKKEHVLISCQIGDGMIAAVCENDPFERALCLLGEADSGRYAGETAFLTAKKIGDLDALMRRTKITRREISAVLVMTDGVADDYYPNAPQLLRLYLDLQINGILGNFAFYELRDFSKNLPWIKKVPEPLAYPWVNEPSVGFALQYAKYVLEKTGLTLPELWQNKDVLYAAFLHTYGAQDKSGCAQEKLLEIWLDNYTERGSFDDRTLVVFKKRRG